MSTTTASAARLATLERVLLLVPTAAGVVFGLLPLVVPEQFAHLAGVTGEDPYVYRIAGAATFGVAAGLIPGLIDGVWAHVRLVVMATLAFSVASLVACGLALADGQHNGILFTLLGVSLAVLAATGWVLYAHRGDPQPASDTGTWLTVFLAVATPVAAAFGLLNLFAPRQFGHFFGLQVADVLTFREAGAALMAYTLLGVFEIRSRVWAEIYGAAVMAGAFNVVAALVSLWALVAGGATSLALVVAVASGLVAIVTVVEFVRRGQ